MPWTSSHLCIACPNCSVEVYTCDAGPCTNGKLQYLLPSSSDSTSVLQVMRNEFSASEQMPWHAITEGIELVEWVWGTLITLSGEAYLWQPQGCTKYTKTQW